VLAWPPPQTGALRAGRRAAGGGEGGREEGRLPCHEPITLSPATNQTRDILPAGRS
jgi:hypothetical protein